MPNSKFFTEQKAFDVIKGKSWKRKLVESVPDSAIYKWHKFLSSEVRVRVGESLSSDFDEIVQAGPFKGMRLSPPHSWSGNTDLFAYTSGIYESHLADFLLGKTSHSKWDCFIDIGAGSGYWALGALYVESTENAYAFEKDGELRKQILSNAMKNQLTITVEGQFKPADSKLSEILKIHPTSMILVDIEGLEFDFFKDGMLERLSTSHLCIELHDRDKQRKLDFIARWEKTHDVSILRRDFWSIDEEISKMVDDLPESAKLACLGEGRSYSQEWLALRPKSYSA